jgi:hypothetical protein
MSGSKERGRLGSVAGRAGNKHWRTCSSGSTSRNTSRTTSKSSDGGIIGSSPSGRGGSGAAALRVVNFHTRGGRSRLVFLVIQRNITIRVRGIVAVGGGLLVRGFLRRTLCRSLLCLGHGSGDDILERRVARGEMM